jgi:hypothetical protein
MGRDMVWDNGGTAVDAYDDTILRQMLKPPGKKGTALLGHGLGHFLACDSEGIRIQARFDGGWVLVIALLERDSSLCGGMEGMIRGCIGVSLNESINKSINHSWIGYIGSYTTAKVGHCTSASGLAVLPLS